MKKIKITTKASNRSKIIEKYGSTGNSVDPESVIQVSVTVEDKSEVYKKLSTDPDVIDWEFDSPEVKTLEKIKELDLLIDQDKIKSSLKTIDLTDMKTILELCVSLRTRIEFFQANYQSCNGTLSITDIILSSIGTLSASEIPSISGELTKVILYAIAGGRKEFSEKFSKSLIKTTKHFIEGSIDVSAITFEGFCQALFIENYRKD